VRAGPHHGASDGRFVAREVLRALGARRARAVRVLFALIVAAAVAVHVAVCGSVCPVWVAICAAKLSVGAVVSGKTRNTLAKLVTFPVARVNKFCHLYLLRAEK
jgi:hypothetical protein